jgi:hypothetical protein
VKSTHWTIKPVTKLKGVKHLENGFLCTKFFSNSMTFHKKCFQCFDTNTLTCVIPSLTLSSPTFTCKWVGGFLARRNEKERERERERDGEREIQMGWFLYCIGISPLYTNTHTHTHFWFKLSLFRVPPFSPLRRLMHKAKYCRSNTHERRLTMREEFSVWR